MGGVTRPRPATRRTRHPPGARAQGCRPLDDRPRAGRTTRGDGRPARRGRRHASRPTRPRPSVCSLATHAAWPASPTRASGASGPTRCSLATASIPRSAGRSRRASRRAARGRRTTSTTTDPRCRSVAGRLTLRGARRRLRTRRTTCRFGGADHSTGSVAGPGRGSSPSRIAQPNTRTSRPPHHARPARNRSDGRN